MKYLVTGGAGFIGSHLAAELLARGAQVTVLDDLSTGRRANLAALEGRPHFRFVTGSVLDRAFVASLVAEAEVVAHLAAAVGVKFILDHPFASIETNVFGTHAVLAECAARGRRVLLASSSEVYGKLGKAPLAEGDDSLLGPTTVGRWSYASTKALDEFMGLAYRRTAALPVVIARFFNVVGPRQTGRYGMVLPRFCRRALAGQDLLVYGDGRQTRTFLHVADCVAGVLRLLESDAALGEVVNVGADREISIGELAERVIRAAGSGSKVRLVPYEQAYGQDFEDLPRRVPDISKVRRLVGWAPARTLDDVIADVLGFCRANPED